MRLAALVGALCLLAAGCSSDRPAAAPAPPPSSLDGYRIVYEVTTFGPPNQTSNRVIIVRRPFSSRDETFTGDETAPSSVTVTSPERAASTFSGQTLDLGGRAPQPPSLDYRFDRELKELEAEGLALPRARASYVARPCRVYRFGAPLGDRLAPITAKEFADLCIDANGLVLAEEWVIDKKPVRRTVALEVDLATPDPSLFEPPASTQSPESVPLTQVVETLPLETTPKIGAHYWVAATPPWGFKLTRRSRVLTISNSVGIPQVNSVAYVDTYERGPDVVTVERLQVRGEGDEPARAAQSVKVAPVGTADITLTAQGPKLEIRRGAWPIVVGGTLDVDRLAYFARSLR